MRLPSSAFPNVPKPGAQGLQLSSKWVSVNHRCRNGLLTCATLRAFLGYLLGSFLLQVRVEGTSPLAIKSSNQKQHLTPIMTHVSVIQKNSMVPYNNYEPVIWGLGGVQACESHCHQWGGGFLRHRACRGNTRLWPTTDSHTVVETPLTHSILQPSVSLTFSHQLMQTTDPGKCL